MEIPVVQKMLNANDLVANQLRELLLSHGVTAINVMGTPGAGKTSLIEQTAGQLGRKATLAVIEGDIATSVDSERLAALGMQVVQINTGGACHLDAGMIAAALPKLDLTQVDLLLIENVGNLVCPAEFDVGEAKKVLITSVAEGDDKAMKYPVAFRVADAIVVNKTDLMPYVDFDIARLRSTLDGLNPEAPVFEVSCTTGQGVHEWTEWLLSCLSEARCLR